MKCPVCSHGSTSVVDSRLKAGKRKHAIPKKTKPAILQVGRLYYIHPEMMRELRHHVAKGGE